MCYRRPGLLLGLLLGTAALSAGAQNAAAPQDHLVLTSLQATYSITSALANGTRIRVVNVPPQGVPMENQSHAFSRLDDALFKEAEAVVTISKLWRDDPLFPAARARNIHVVNIDASFPWNSADFGVSVIREPTSDVPWVEREAGGEEAGLSRFAWLSPTNAIRMSELVAGDLLRLSPGDAERIRANLTALNTELRQIKAEYGAKSAALADPRVMSLAQEFVYLLADLGVFVDGWFIKQDVNWTDQDRSALTAYLKEHGIKVVVHKWMPEERIAAAVKSAGAQLVVLDAGDASAASSGAAMSARGYPQLLRSDMDALLQALSTGKTP